MSNTATMAHRGNHRDMRETTRVVVGGDDDPEAPAFGIAWYEGTFDFETNEWRGAWVGNDSDSAKAEAFLAGEDVLPEIRAIEVPAPGG